MIPQVISELGRSKYLARLVKEIETEKKSKASQVQPQKATYKPIRFALTNHLHVVEHTKKNSHCCLFNNIKALKGLGALCIGGRKEVIRVAKYLPTDMFSSGKPEGPALCKSGAVSISLVSAMLIIVQLSYTKVTSCPTGQYTGCYLTKKNVGKWVLAGKEKRKGKGLPRGIRNKKDTIGGRHETLLNSSEECSPLVPLFIVQHFHHDQLVSHVLQPANVVPANEAAIYPISLTKLHQTPHGRSYFSCHFRCWTGPLLGFQTALSLPSTPFSVDSVHQTGEQWEKLFLDWNA